jgi:hypothetical protein
VISVPRGQVFKERGALIEATIAYIKDREIVLDNGLECVCCARRALARGGDAL